MLTERALEAVGGRREGEIEAEFEGRCRRRRRGRLVGEYTLHIWFDIRRRLQHRLRQLQVVVPYSVLRYRGGRRSRKLELLGLASPTETVQSCSSETGNEPWKTHSVSG